MVAISAGRSPRRYGLVLLLLSALGLGRGRADAQCTILQQPTKFDPPAEGISPTDMYGRQDSMAITSGDAAAKRLIIRYSYGFLVYNLGAPAAPVKAWVESLKSQDGYPKNGDGLERTGPLSMSSDGTRAAVPWTDTANFGTVALTYTATGFSGGGDFLPKGRSVGATAIARVGTRYLGFSTYYNTVATTLYAADLTSIPTGVAADPEHLGTIPSEPATSIDFGGEVRTLKAVEAQNRTWLVAATLNRVTVVEVTNAGGSVPGLTSGFTSRGYSLAELGLNSGSILSIAAAAHPDDGSLHVLVETAVKPGTTNTSLGVSLTRIDPSTGSPTVLGTYLPPSGANQGQPASLLLPLGQDLGAVFLEGRNAGGMEIHVHTATDFPNNLAAGQVLNSFESVNTFTGFRPSGTSIYLYLGRRTEASYAAAISCATAPAPATATLSVERILKSGTVESIADGGTVYVGDKLRIKPIFSPPHVVKPVIDWRLDLDYHAGTPLNPLEASATTPRIVNPDESATESSLAVPLTEYLLRGPCDPAQLPQGGGTAPDPATGAGCWTSVTTNGTYTTDGQPDFAADVAGGAKKELLVGFEVRNDLNGANSSLATHRIKWEVPSAVLKTTALLAGGTVSIDPKGWPSSTGFRWYFGSAPVGQQGADVLNLNTSCTGPTCLAGLTQAGTYRYWVSVPYENGFRTPDCPGLDQALTSCTGDAAKTVQVTEVVLGFTVPQAVFAGGLPVTIASTSQKASIATPCPTSSNGWAYDLCVLSGGSCAAGSFSGDGLGVSGDPFAGGALTIPTPQIGNWGVRLRYSYTTSGSCSSPTVATWPSDGGWAPLNVSEGQVNIKLRNVSDTADITFSAVFDSYSLNTNQSATAWAEINGVRATAPLPAGFGWAYENQDTGSRITFGTGQQGASFSIPTAGTYKVILTGYGTERSKNLDVSASGGSGGGGTPPTGLSISSFLAYNPYPDVGVSTDFNCNVTGGTTPYSFRITFGDGDSYTGPYKSTSHAYAAAGDYTAQCTVTDATQTSRSRSAVVYVGGGGGGGGGGTCDVKISGPGGVIMPAMGDYYVSSGQLLTIESVNTSETASWTFGDGTTGSGSPVTHSYVNATDAEIERTLKLTAGSCTKSYKVFVSPSAGPDFTIADAGTGTALEWVTDAYKASAGQSLRFTATGTTGAVSWDFGDGTSSTEASPAKTYAPLVDTTYVARLTNGDKNKQTNIRVAGSTGAALTGNYMYTYADGSAVNRAAVEPNKAIRFTGVDQATSYTWDFGDGTALGAGSPALHTFTRGGTFPVKLTVARDGVPGTVTTAAPTAFVVKPPPDPLLWVAAGMAYTDNGAGVKWQSDISIFNPGTQTATLSLGFVSGAAWDGATKVDWRALALVAGETKSYSNVLKNLFRLDQGAWGVVLVRGDDIPVAPVIVSRTYNAAAAETAGTFGLSVPALSVAAGVQPQSATGGNYLVGLRHDSSYRTNLTVANLKDEAADVEVVFRGADGASLGSPAKITVEGRGVKQLNAVLAAPVANGGAGWETPAPSFSAEVQLKKGSGIYPYATVIDAGTGDAIVVTPAARPSARYRLPGILRYGLWRSDVSLLNPTANERRIRLEYSYVKKGEADRTTKAKTLTLKAFETKAWNDFFGAILELPPGDTTEYSDSFVDFTTPADDAHKDDPFVVNGKTYAASGKGTIGLQVDPYVFEEGIGAQAASRRILLSGLQANTRFRTNLALFTMQGAGGEDWAEMDVHVLDSFGRELRNIWVRLDADHPVKQIGSADLFAGLTTSDTEAATIVISNPRGTARVGAYATVIDNLSSDATFVAGQPVP